MQVMRRDLFDTYLGRYRLDLTIPAGTPPPGGWPTLYLLDPSGCFGTAVEACARMSRRPDATGVHPLVIAGIGSPDGLDVARRRRDFTGDAFLDLLTGAVAKAVAAEAPVNPADRTLFGHSLAGLFALSVLHHRPDAYRGYVAVSPSIWSDRFALEAAADALVLPSRDILILAGEWEGDLPPWQAARADAPLVRARRAERDMLGAAQALAARLAAAPGRPRVDFAILPQEDHASIVSAAMPRALRLASRRAAP
jgi:uncharacterized protein